MAQPKYHRVAVAQLSFNPAYLDESGVSYLHEPVFPSDDDHGLYKLGGLPEVHELRSHIAASLVDHMSHKIRTIVEFAALQRAELLLLPEYSVPPELLQECVNLSRDFNTVIIAGSHIATRPAINEHSRLGMNSAGKQTKIGRAVCPVFLPNGKCHLFEKINRSKWESSLEPGGESAPISVNLGNESVQIEVLICLDALQEPSPVKGRRGRHILGLTVMPSLTPSVELFYKKAELLLASGKVVLFANISEFGGSRVFARTERTKSWLVGNDGTEPITAHSEAVIILDADLASQFEVRKSTGEHFPVREVSVTPIVYTKHSDACRQFLELLSSIENLLETNPEGLQENLTRFTAMDYRLFPRLMQEKLKHFLTSLASPGLADATAWRRWLTPVVVDTTVSTDALRWDLCGRAIELVNELTLSGKYPEKTDLFTATFKYLANKRNQLRTRMEPPPSKSALSLVPVKDEAQQTSTNVPPFEPPFFDRQPILGSVQNFINSADKTCFVLAGMRGIGKTSIAREVSKRVIPPTWKRMWIPLTEGASFPRLLAEFAHHSGLRIPSDSSLDSLAKQIDLAQNLLLSFSHTPRLAVIFDDFQYLLEPSGEFADGHTGDFILQLIQVASTRGNKLMIVTNQIPKVEEQVRNIVESRHLKGLDQKDAEDLFSYWARFEREGLGGQLVSLPEKLLAVLNGHPLAVKVAAKLVTESTTQHLESETAIFKRLRETIISFFLDRVELSQAEDEFILFASVFRLPVPRDAFVAWKADQAGFLLDSLVGRSLLETDGEEYSLHPIIRDHFYTTTGLEVLRRFHRVAGGYFLERYRKAKNATTDVNPELLGEAIHHYLCAGDRDKVRGFALYKYELRPVALMHYKKREYNRALKDYRVLIALDSTDADAHFHLSLIYSKSRVWDRAEEHFGKAIHLKPNAYWILQGYAHAKLTDNQIEQAEQLLLQSHEINPRYSPTLTDLGRVYSRLGDETTAESYFKQAIECGPNDAFAYAAYARFLLHTQRFEEGLQIAMAALETNPTDERNKDLVKEIRERLQAATKTVSGAAGKIG